MMTITPRHCAVPRPKAEEEQPAPLLQAGKQSPALKETRLKHKGLLKRTSCQ